MKQYMGIIVILMLVAGLVAGCNGGSPTPEETAVLESPDISTPSESTSKIRGSDSSTSEEAIETGKQSPSDETPGKQPQAQSTPATEPISGQPSGSTPSTSSSDPGMIEIVVTDAPPGYEITSIEVEVSGIEVHQAQAEQEQDREQDDDGIQNNNKNKGKQNSQGKGVTGNDESTPTPDDASSDESDAVVEDTSGSTDGTGSWISLDIKGTFDLLIVKENPLSLGTNYLDPGKYTQVRIAVDSVMVEYLDGSSSETQTAVAEVPSGKLKFVRPFNIASGHTTSLLFDFIADKSVVFTGSDKVIFKPVIKLQVSDPVPATGITTTIPDLDITTSSLSDGTVNEFYSATLAATGGTTPYVWTWSGTLPSGLSLDSTGVISGTPAAAGTYDFTVQVNDNDSQSDTQALSISINAAVSPLEITTTSLPDGEEGTGYTGTLEAIGGTTPYAWTWSGTLPSGLSLDSSGVISGTPTVVGTYDFTVQVDDSDSQSDTTGLSILVE